MKLKEILNIYEQYGLADEEIIERYFCDNHIEDKGIQLLTKLSEKRFQFLNYKISFHEECVFGLQSVLCNDIPENDKMTLQRLLITFTFTRDLDKQELEEIKGIFDKYEIKCCPVYFIAYLSKEGIYTKQTYDYWFNRLELVIKMRDN